MTRLICRTPIACLCSGEVIPVVIRRGAEPPRQTTACAACRAVAQRIGLAMEDARPKWLQGLSGRDETGAVLNPEAVR